MSIVIASTTDSQEQVNAAAGVTTPQVQAQAAVPSEAPPETTQDGETESATESDTAEDTPDQEDSEESPQKAKHPNVQRRIDRLVRDKYQLSGRVQELERRLMESAPRPPQQSGPPPAQPQTQQGEPQEAQFERYEDFIKAQARWTVAQEFAEYQRQQRQQAEAFREQQREMEFNRRLQAAASAMPDFHTAMADADDIKFPEKSPLETAIKEHEDSGKLLYELARHRDEFEKIAKLSWQSPHAAIRELGKFEAKYLNGDTKAPAISKAPPPITPVGQGSTKSTKSPDEMSHKEYRLWRIKNGAYWK